MHLFNSIQELAKLEASKAILCHEKAIERNHSIVPVSITGTKYKGGFISSTEYAPKIAYDERYYRELAMKYEKSLEKLERNKTRLLNSVLKRLLLENQNT